MRARLRVLPAAALLVAFSVSVWATCLDGAAVSQHQQMACCKDGEFACDPHGSSHDCCGASAKRSQDAVASARLDPVRQCSLAIVCSVLPDAAIVTPVRVVAAPATSPPSARQGPHPDIAYSSLLI